MSKKIFNINERDWIKFEKNKAKDIYVKDLDPDRLTEKISIKLMRVLKNGEFPSHRDPYSHIFYLISGVGEVLLEEKVCKMESGLVAIIKAGENHGYRNTGKEDMYLITMNIPED